MLPDTELVRVVVTAGTAGTVTAGEAERAMPPPGRGPLHRTRARRMTAVCPHALRRVDSAVPMANSGNSWKNFHREFTALPVTAYGVLEPL